MLDHYIAQAVAHRDALSAGDHVRANKAYRKLDSARRQLRELGAEGVALLAQAAHHDIAGVRAWAATHLLESHPDVALPVLQDISSGDDLVALSARMVLEEFRRGNVVGR